jgi:type I restriction enzyme S subunit
MRVAVQSVWFLEELDGAIVSNDFPSFEFIDRTQARSPAFMGWMVRSRHFVESVQSCERRHDQPGSDQGRSFPGTADYPATARRTTSHSRPPRHTLGDKARQVNEHLDAIEGNAHRLLRAYIFCPPGETPNRKRVSELLTLRLPDVKVNRLQRYHFAGVYSFVAASSRASAKMEASCL